MTIAIIDTCLVTLPELAVLANQYHAEVQGAARGTVEAARRAGEALLTAKEQVKHGEWLPWLRDNFTASDRIAQAYMRIASNPQRVSDLDELPLREALKAITSARNDHKPKPERKPGRRKALPAAFRSAVHQVTKSVDTVERLSRDDRFTKNLDQITYQLGDLSRARDVLQHVIETIQQEAPPV